MDGTLDVGRWNRCCHLPSNLSIIKHCSSGIATYINSSVSTWSFHRTKYFQRAVILAQPVPLSMLSRNYSSKILSNQLSYASYYSQCQPQFCQYTVTERSELLYVVTSLLGFYGGLSVVLRLIIPHLINFLVRKMR